MLQPTRRSSVLKSRKFEVQRWSFDGPAAVGGERDIVVHPGAVVVLPLLGGRDVLLVRNFRHAIGHELLELPAGTLEAGESALSCAARELAEETGYRARHLQPLCSFYSAPGFCTERLHAFVATDLVAGAPQLEVGEMIQPEVHPLERVLKMVAEGTIQDAKTIAALAVYQMRGGSC